MKPRDPITENMNILKGKPVKAFLYQDHQAHIATHMAMVQDPKIQQLIAQDPQMAQKLQAVGAAHVADHLAMEYRKQMEQAMGQTLPAYVEEQEETMMAPDMEVKVAQMAAQASQQLLQQHQQEAQQQEAQKQAQDPLVQLQQKELQIKEQDLQRKIAKDQAEIQAKLAQIQVELKRIEATQETEGARLAFKAQSEQDSRDHQQEQLGFNTGINMSKPQPQPQNPNVGKGDK